MTPLDQRVLVIDDSEVTRAILSRTLRGAGFEVLEARDGVEGAMLALAERPAVVVTDLEMPTLDGFPLLRLLKSDPASADIPVLIMTTHGEAASRFWSRRTGADAYLTKDYRPQQLVETVSRLADQSPPPSEAWAPIAVGPLDVLARVARQLDASLLQATVTNAVLERGMAASDFQAAFQAALQTLREVIDARFLALAWAEETRGTIHIQLEDPLAEGVVDAIQARLLTELDLPAGAAVTIDVSGERGDTGADLGAAVWLRLALRGGRGLLAVLARDPFQLAATTLPLLSALLQPLALVLDNARLAERLHELSTIDGLTLQLNHRVIYDRLTEELERARRYRQPLSVVLCDLDHFKRINDTHGHQAGDAVLREGAGRLRRTLRATDLLGRYGGEEFLCVLPQVDLESACQAAERLRLALAATRVELPDGGRVEITGSFGVATKSELPHPVTGDQLVSLADRRLYEAKAAGRNRVHP